MLLTGLETQVQETAKVKTYTTENVQYSATPSHVNMPFWYTGSSQEKFSI